jgi:hypothetical protein
MDQEACPICWRNFSLEVKPICLPCGHSCCFECSQVIRSCSLCRHRITTNFQRKTNYALLSLLEKLQRTSEIQRLNQETQTDIDMVQPLPPNRRQRQETVPIMDGKTMTVQIKRSAIQLSFK